MCSVCSEVEHSESVGAGCSAEAEAGQLGGMFQSSIPHTDAHCLMTGLPPLKPHGLIHLCIGSLSGSPLGPPPSGRPSSLLRVVYWLLVSRWNSRQFVPSRREGVVEDNELADGFEVP